MMAVGLMVAKESDALKKKESRILKRTVFLAGALTLGVIAAAGLGFFLTRPYSFKGMQFNPPAPAPEFALVNQDRQNIRMGDLRGKPVLLTFGYTNCKDVCPITLAKWQRIAKILGDDAAHVRFVMVSVDPQRDPPERLKEYLAQFNPAFERLTGTLQDTEDLAALYNAYFKIEYVEEDSHSGDSHDNYVVRHTALSYLIDSSGRLLLAFRFDDSAEDIAADIRWALAH